MGSSGVGPALLTLRAALLGVVVTGVGVVSHTAADGLLPGAVGLGVVGLAAGTLGAFFLRAPASRARMVALVVGGQTLVHLLLSLLGGHRGDPAVRAAPVAPHLDWRSTLAAGDGVGSFREQMSGLDTVVLGQGPGEAATGALDLGWVAQLAAHAGATGPWMLLAHTGAAVVVGLWLAAGESALWSLVTLVAAVVCAAATRLVAGGPLDPPPLVVRRERWVPAQHRTHRPTPVLLLVPSRRGPPLLAA